MVNSATFSLTTYLFAVLLISLADLRCHGQAPRPASSVAPVYEAAISTLLKEKSDLVYFYFLESKRNHEPIVILLPDSIPVPASWREKFGVLPLHLSELCGVVKMSGPVTVVRFHLCESRAENEQRVGMAVSRYCKQEAGRCIEKVFPKPIGAGSGDFELTLTWSPKDGAYKHFKPRI